MANVYTIQSHTDKAKTYTVTFPDTGAPYCTCVGYGYRRTCSHIKEAYSKLQDELLEHLRLTISATVFFCKTPDCGVQLTGTHTFTGKCAACYRRETFSYGVRQPVRQEPPARVYS